MRKRRGDLTEKESEDSSSVEHFIPKSTLPALAYEWSNYRLASRKVNKFRDKKDILDPFKVENGWFRLEVAGGDLYANPDLPDLLKEQVEKTILNLGLNEDWCIRRRQQYYNVYNTLCEQGHSTEKITQYLSENAPILLVELRLQGRLP